jgi:hypothetical protein
MQEKGTNYNLSIRKRIKKSILTIMNLSDMIFHKEMNKETIKRNSIQPCLLEERV